MGPDLLCTHSEYVIGNKENNVLVKHFYKLTTVLATVLPAKSDSDVVF